MQPVMELRKKYRDLFTERHGVKLGFMSFFAKAAVEAMTRNMAWELGPYGITVNCVVPGKIGGKRSATSGHSVSLPGGGQPLVGREGTPEDVAEVVVFLCSPGAEMIRGQTVIVDGGFSLLA